MLNVSRLQDAAAPLNGPSPQRRNPMCGFKLVKNACATIPARLDGVGGAVRGRFDASLTTPAKFRRCHSALVARADLAAKAHRSGENAPKRANICG
jgi:hypothetical protein